MVAEPTRAAAGSGADGAKCQIFARTRSLCSAQAGLLNGQPIAHTCLEGRLDIGENLRAMVILGAAYVVGKKLDKWMRSASVAVQSTRLTKGPDGVGPGVALNFTAAQEAK